MWKKEILALMKKSLRRLPLSVFEAQLSKCGQFTLWLYHYSWQLHWKDFVQAGTWKPNGTRVSWLQDSCSSNFQSSITLVPSNSYIDREGVTKPGKIWTLDNIHKPRKFGTPSFSFAFSESLLAFWTWVDPPRPTQNASQISQFSYVFPNGVSRFRRVQRLSDWNHPPLRASALLPPFFKAIFSGQRVPAHAW